MAIMYCQNPNSQGGVGLAASLGIRRIRHQNTRFVGRPSKVVINWGSSEVPLEVLKCRVINNPLSVGIASNKKAFFDHLSDHESLNLPEHTSSFEEAIKWVTEGATVVARTMLTGHSGRGIVLMTYDTPETFVNAPLYTRYVKKADEYRVHVFGNKVVDIQRKALSSTAIREDIDWRVRNHQSGFIYARNDVHLPESALEQARLAVEYCGLDFGAVDIIHNSHYNKYYVLEVNTAPGLTGTTLAKYTEAMEELI